MAASGDFRERVTVAGEKAVQIVEDALKGAPVPADRVKLASLTMGAALKVEHMNQLREQSSVSNGLRLIGMLRDPEVRKKYFDIMQPKIMPKVSVKSLSAGKE